MPIFFFCFFVRNCKFVMKIGPCNVINLAGMRIVTDRKENDNNYWHYMDANNAT